MSPAGPTGAPWRRGTTQFWQRDIRFGLIALAVPAAVAFGALAFAITLSPQFRSVDELVSAEFQFAMDGAGFAPIAELVTWLGSTLGIIVVTLAAVVLLLATRHWRGTLYLLATLVPGWLFGLLVKEVVDRARPLTAIIPLPTDASFPSGHSLASFLLYGSLAVLAVTWVSPRWLAWTLSVLAGAVIVAVGMSRVVLGVHFFADVLGSWLLGLAWLAVTSTTYLALVGPGRPNGTRPTETHVDADA